MLVRSKSNLRSVVVGSDFHIPDHDVRAIDAFGQFLEDLRPDNLILNGDIQDFKSCTQHPGAEEWGLDTEEEFHLGSKFMGRVRRAVGDECDIDYCEGNHETRPRRLIGSVLPQLRNLGKVKNMSEALNLGTHGIRYHLEDEQPLKRGQLIVIHGHQQGKGKKSFLPIHHAKKMAELYGLPGHTVVYGHTHKEQVFAQSQYHGNMKAIGLGCMARLDPKWTDAKTGGWIHQFGFGWILPSGETHFYPVTIKNGAFVANGKLYVGRGPECKKFSLAWGS